MCDIVISVVLCDNTLRNHCDCRDHVKFLPICICGQAVKSSDSVMGRGHDKRHEAIKILISPRMAAFAALAVSLSTTPICSVDIGPSTDRISSFQVPVSSCVSICLSNFRYIESLTELLGQCPEPFDII